MASVLRSFAQKPFNLPPEVETVGQFLDAFQQGPASRERFWIPLCDSVMNVPVETAPIRGLGEVLNRIFFGTRFDSAFGIAAKPLSELGFDRVPSHLEAKGGKVHFHAGVQAFQADSKTFELTTRSGKKFSGNALIWAVPPTSLSALWPRDNWAAVEKLPQLGKSPILSIHILLSQSVTEEHFFGLSGAKFEWVFNRNANWGWKGEGIDSHMLSAQPSHAPTLEAQGRAQYLSFTASAAGELAKKTEKELVDLAMTELQERCPAARQARVLHAKVTREMAATFVWTAQSGKLRLPCETPFSNVFLAGDWTDTGLPATIEGACVSGHRAADKVREVLA